MIDYKWLSTTITWITIFFFSTILPLQHKTIMTKCVKMCDISIIEKIKNKKHIKWSYKGADIHVEGRFVYKCYYTFFFLFTKMPLLFFGNKNMGCWGMETNKTSAKLRFWKPNLTDMLEVGRQSFVLGGPAL